MNFTSNHDENSWQGTVFERYGDGYKTMAVLMATIDGIPLLYGGQEAGLDKRLKFFAKDTINWNRIPLKDLYTTLFELRKKNKALWSGDHGGRSVRLNSDNGENVYAYIRSKGGNNVLVLLNLSEKERSFTLETGHSFGSQREAFTNDVYEIDDTTPITLNPWGFRVFAFEIPGI